MNKKLRKKRGFSLIELIVVMGIIAVLAVVAVPRYNSYLAKARLNSDRASAKVIADVAEVYAADEGGDDFSVDLSSSGHVLESYLGKVPELQSVSSGSFKVKCTGGIINVYYETNGNTAEKIYLYPKDKEPEAIPASTE